MRRAAERLATGLLILAVLWVSVGSPPALGADSPQIENRVFEIRYKRVEDIVVLIRHLMGPQGSLRLHPRLNTITLISFRQQF